MVTDTILGQKHFWTPRLQAQNGVCHPPVIARLNQPEIEQKHRPTSGERKHE